MFHEISFRTSLTQKNLIQKLVELNSVLLYSLLWKNSERLSTKVEIDPEKHKFFTSKLKIWGYAKISALEFQNLSFEDKSKILRNYHTEMSPKYLLNSGPNLFCYSCLVNFFMIKFNGNLFSRELCLFVCYSSQCSASFEF